MRTFVSQPVIKSSALNADALAWFAAVEAAGGTVSSARRVLIDNLIVGLKGDGLWDKLDRLWLFAAENAISALRDLKYRAVATAVSSPTFTTDRGYRSDGSASYINSNFAFSSGVAFQTNSAHMSAYVRNAINFNNANTVGAVDGTADSYILLYVGSPVGWAFTVNEPSGSGDGTGVTGTGHGIGNRSALAVTQFYKNGALADTGTNSTAGGGRPTREAFILARNNSGTADAFMANTNEMSVVSIGGSLAGGSDAANFSGRINEYMRAVGANTY